jgi:hypothetical protein
MTPMRPPAVILLALALALPSQVAAQEHAHHPPPAGADPLLRLTLEGPHLVLVHHGFIVLTGAELDALYTARRRLCAAEVVYAHDRKAARAALASELAADATEGRVHAAIDEVARIDAAWMRALALARDETMGALDPVSARRWSGSVSTGRAR